MAIVIPISGQGEWRKDYRYAVYEHKLVTADGLTYSRSFIVIKNTYGVIIRFTRLHNFVGAYENRVYRPLASDAKEKLYYICRMLNYVLVDHYSIYRTDHVFKITKDMLSSFFMDYALEKKPDGTHKGSQSIEKCVHTVTLFFSKLIYKYGLVWWKCAQGHSWRAAVYSRTNGRGCPYCAGKVAVKTRFIT